MLRAIAIWESTFYSVSNKLQFLVIFKVYLHEFEQLSTSVDSMRHSQDLDSVQGQEVILGSILAIFLDYTQEMFLSPYSSLWRVWCSWNIRILLTQRTITKLSLYGSYLCRHHKHQFDSRSLSSFINYHVFRLISRQMYSVIINPMNRWPLTMLVRLVIS